MKPEFAKAIIEVQTELKNPTKDKQAYGYKYADLAKIIDETKAVLQKHGLVVLQHARSKKDGRVGVETILIHESGESISSKLFLPIPQMKGTSMTQNAGAALTYARRYSLSSILGISADDDTDAAGDSEPTQPVKPQTNVPKVEGNVPLCPIHHTPFKMRTGQYGSFWSCGTKLADGTYCKAKPNQDIVNF